MAKRSRLYNVARKKRGPLIRSMCIEARIGRVRTKKRIENIQKLANLLHRLLAT